MNAFKTTLAVFLASALSGCLIVDHRPVSRAEKAVQHLAGPDRSLDEAETELNRLCERGCWDAAAKMCRQRLAECRSDRSLVFRGTQLAILNWNRGDRAGAVIAMDAVIAACSRLGPGRDGPAVRFRNDMRNGKIDGKFTVEEAIYFVGIRKAIADAVCR